MMLLVIINDSVLLGRQGRKGQQVQQNTFFMCI